MSISIAHMIEIVNPQPRDTMNRAEYLGTIRKIILRKRIREHSNLIDFFFAFQFFLAGAFIAAVCYA